MTVHEILLSALSGLAPKVGRAPLSERPDTYIAWFVLRSAPESASNRWYRVQHLIQVDLYSRRPLDELLDQTLRRLQLAGCNVESWGPELYESDTRYRHIPITLRLATAEAAAKENEKR